MQHPLGAAQLACRLEVGLLLLLWPQILLRGSILGRSVKVVSAAEAVILMQ